MATWTLPSMPSMRKPPEEKKNTLETLHLLGTRIRKRRLLSRRPPWKEIEEDYKQAILALAERDEREEQTRPMLRGYSGVLEAGVARCMEAQRSLDGAAHHHHRAGVAFADEHAAQRDGGAPGFDLYKHEALSAFREAVNIHVTEGLFSKAAALYLELAARLELFDDCYNAVVYYKRAAEFFRKQAPPCLHYALFSLQFALRLALRSRDVSSALGCLSASKDVLVSIRRQGPSSEIEAELSGALVTEMLLCAHEGKFRVALHLFQRLVALQAAGDGEADVGFSWSRDLLRLQAPSTKSKNAEVYRRHIREHGELLDGLGAFLMDLLWTIEFREFERFLSTAHCEMREHLSPIQLLILDRIEEVLTIQFNVR